MKRFFTVCLEGRCMSGLNKITTKHHLFCSRALQLVIVRVLLDTRAINRTTVLQQPSTSAPISQQWDGNYFQPTINNQERTFKALKNISWCLRTVNATVCPSGTQTGAILQLCFQRVPLHLQNFFTGTVSKTPKPPLYMYYIVILHKMCHSEVLF